MGVQDYRLACCRYSFHWICPSPESQKNRLWSRRNRGRPSRPEYLRTLSQAQCHLRAYPASRHKSCRRGRTSIASLHGLGTEMLELLGVGGGVGLSQLDIVNFFAQMLQRRRDNGDENSLAQAALRR